MNYHEFIKQKHIKHTPVGFDPIGPLPAALKDWQDEVVRWACINGRAGLFERPGLGKTLQQLSWAQEVCRYTKGRVIILAPLVVASQTVRESEKFGIDGVGYSRDGGSLFKITVTNYEMLKHFNPNDFMGVVLDESSILKSFMGKTKQALMDAFSRTPFRLVASATPAPNDHMELLNQADFLGIMPSNEALARWFINDTMNMGKYKLLPHATKDFWEWVSSWAVCMESPEDIGFDGSEFKLQELKRIEHIVKIEHDFSNGQLFADDRPVSATDLYSELRETAEERTKACADYVGDGSDGWIIWCNTNHEQKLLENLFKGQCHSVYGSLKPEEKERRILSWLDGGNKPIMISKPSMMGFGLNFQHIHKQAFVGLSYSYEQLFQAECRLHRFGQKHPVESHLFMSPKERKTYEVVSKKARKHEEMRQNMVSEIGKTSDIKRKAGLNLMADYETQTWKGENWELTYGDSCQEIKKMDDNSMDFCIHSPPFSSLYIYSDSAMDMGNCADDDEFFTHYDFLIGELLRVMRPGRLVAIHCKQLVDYKGRDGRAGLRDFRGEIIRHFEDAGFKYHSEVCIWKDPVIEMQRTKAHGLLHKQTKKDSTFSRQGLPDYLVIMRKWADESNHAEVVPVSREKGFQKYVGEDAPERKGDSEYDAEGHSIHVWQRYASPVWWDIRQTRVLNKAGCKDDWDEKHICPLQLDVIERAVHLWSNPGELVYTPFAGRGSELYGAVSLGRKAMGHELKLKYCQQAVKDLTRLEAKHEQVGLFA